MTTKLNAQNIPWRRLLAEGAAIVVSILLAFWIDASWQSRQEAEQGRRLADALLIEVAENGATIVEMIGQSHEAIALTKTLLAVIASENHDEHGLIQLKELGNIFFKWGWTPRTDVYSQALASGQIMLIDDSNLRIQIAGYHSALDRVRLVMNDIDTQYNLHLEPFLAKNTIYTDVAFSKWLEGTPQPPFSTDLVSLSKNPELWSLIALRLENDITMTDALERAQEVGDELTESLLAYLE